MGAESIPAGTEFQTQRAEYLSQGSGWFFAGAANGFVILNKHFAPEGH